MGSFGAKRRRKNTIKAIPVAPKTVKAKEAKPAAVKETKAAAVKEAKPVADETKVAAPAPEVKPPKAPVAKKEPKAKKTVEATGKNE